MVDFALRLRDLSLVLGGLRRLGDLIAKLARFELADPQIRLRGEPDRKRQGKQYRRGTGCLPWIEPVE